MASALDKALISLQGLLSRRPMASSTRLPTIPALARAAGVAPGTMRRAVLRLRDQGVLTVSPRRGIHCRFALPAADTAERRPELRPAWKRVRQRMVADIESGLWPHGSVLPSVKELGARYGCSPPTVSKALDGLAAAGRIAAAGRGYRVPALQAAAGRNTIVVIVRGTEGGAPVPIGTWAPRNRQQYQALEQLAALAGCSLEFVVYRYAGGRLVGPDGQPRLNEAIGLRDGVLGFMLWCQGLADLDLPAYARDLTRFGKPVAVLTVDDSVAFPRLGSLEAPCRVFPLGTDERCGEIVGSYLLGQGHRGADFLTVTGLRSRYNGLRRVFDAAGLGGAVDYHDLSSHRPPRKDEEVQTVFDAITRSARSSATARSFAGFLAHDQEELVDRATSVIWHQSLTPHILRSLERAEHTALVCENDNLALHCLGLLRERGVRVPQDKSVIGFDDDEEAFLSGLTSYNFNVKAVVAAMLEHIVRPERGGELRNRGPTVIEGYVNARMTSGPLGRPRPWIHTLGMEPGGGGAGHAGALRGIGKARP